MTTPPPPAQPPAVPAPRTAALLSIAALGVDDAEVIELDGEEELGRAPRFEITFALAGPELDPAEAVGAAARLLCGDARTLGGVIAEMETGEALPDGRRAYRATLAPRAWLLSRGRRSRVFERLSTPDVVEAVVAASGLDLHVARGLRDAYPTRACTVQHRESDLDFILRLLEGEGICLRVTDDGGRCTLSLSDHNEALPHHGELRGASGLRRKSTLLPRRVALVGLDPARPELPLQASALVSASGVGELEIHDARFSTPEEGAREAQLAAERLRSTATVLHGAVPGLLAAGHRARVEGREILVVSVRHALSREGACTSRFSAVPADVLFRPERRAAVPRVVGLQGGRLAPPEGNLDEGGYRVRAIGGGAPRTMPMAGRGGFERELVEGASVVWGCLDGDPERPIITAVLADLGVSAAQSARAVLRGPGGSLFELGGAAAPGLGEIEGVLEGARGAAPVPAVAHRATGTYEQDDSGSGTTDTWVRFAVPHTDGAWSYLRVGEAALATGTTITSTAGKSFTESSSQCVPLSLNSYTTAGLEGVFDHTDKNRTEITKGNWEQIVEGNGRLAVYAGESTPHYELSVNAGQSVHQTFNAPQFAYTSGMSLNFFGGLSTQNTVGTYMQTTLGGGVNFNLGLTANITAGYQMDLVFADSYEYRRGEMLSSVSTLDQRASEQIQFSINDGSEGVSTEMKIAAAAALVATTALVGVSSFHESNKKVVTGAVTGGLAAVLLGGLALMRVKSKEVELLDGNPIMSLDKNHGVAALRADDWLFMMSPDWAVLGKNKAYSVETEVKKLKDTDAGTALVLEEGNKVRLQAGAVADSMAVIQLEGKTITITADTIEIKGTSADTSIKITGAVEIDGALTVKKTLAVTGETTLSAKLTAGTGGTLKAP